MQMVFVARDTSMHHIIRGRVSPPDDADVRRAVRKIVHFWMTGHYLIAKEQPASLDSAHTSRPGNNKNNNNNSSGRNSNHNHSSNSHTNNSASTSSNSSSGGNNDNAMFLLAMQQDILAGGRATSFAGQGLGTGLAQGPGLGPRLGSGSGLGSSLGGIRDIEEARGRDSGRDVSNISGGNGSSSGNSSGSGGIINHPLDRVVRHEIGVSWSHVSTNEPTSVTIPGGGDTGGGAGGGGGGGSLGGLNEYEHVDDEGISYHLSTTLILVAIHTA